MQKKERAKCAHDFRFLCVVIGETQTQSAWKPYLPGGSCFTLVVDADVTTTVGSIRFFIVSVWGGRTNLFYKVLVRYACFTLVKGVVGNKTTSNSGKQATSNKQQQSTTQKSNSFWCHSWMIWVMQFKSAHMSQIFKVALLSCHDDLSTCFLVVALL